MTWRQGKGVPLTREEMDRLNRLLADLSLGIPDLRDRRFLDSLPGKVDAGADGPVAVPLTETQAAELARELVELSQLQPHPRGYAFQDFLNKLFTAYGLEPRKPFRLTGEQIDGSFVLENETYRWKPNGRIYQWGERIYLRSLGKCRGRRHGRVACL